MADEQRREVVTTEVTVTEDNQVYIRKKKSLIVGPKKGLTAFLARCALGALFMIRSIAPFSIVFLGFQTFRAIYLKRAFWMSRKPWKRLFAGYVLIETLFYCYMRHKQNKLQLKPSIDRVPQLTATERRILFQRCMQSASSTRAFLESWFDPVCPYSEQRRGNVQEFIAWSMFHKSDWRKEMTEEEKLQLEEFVQEVESRAGPLMPGYNPETKMLKFTEEPVEGKHRPFVMYLVVHYLFQGVLAPLQMRLAGYSNHREGSLTYWYRPGRNPNLPPVCFMHGIGIGILPYQNWLRVVESLCDGESGGLAGRGVIVPEIHVISARLNPTELHCDTFVAELKGALTNCSGHARACFVGHSYGTFCAAWLLKRAPEIVGALGLIDPPSVLLHNTEVLHNIVYHRPLPNAVEAVLDYIMRSEVSLVHNLRRQFFWYANVLFLEDIDTENCPTFVCLGDTDQLVPIHEVRKYVENFNNKTFIDVPEAIHKSEAPIDLLWFERCDHAGYLFNKGFERKVAEAIGAICERSPLLKETKLSSKSG